MADVIGADNGASEARATVELVSADAGVATFKVAGELDVSTESVLREGLDRVMVDQPSKIVLDVSDLSFMDSSGLAVLLLAARQVPTLELHEPTEVIRRLITISGLTETLKLTP